VDTPTGTSVDSGEARHRAIASFAADARQLDDVNRGSCCVRSREQGDIGFEQVVRIGEQKENVGAKLQGALDGEDVISFSCTSKFV
jgi:hypothetical protein